MKTPTANPGASLVDQSQIETVPNLSLEDTGAQTLRGLKLPDARSAGVNPYESGPATRSATGMHRQAEMRKLSEWIRLKRDVDRRKKSENG